MLMTKCSLHTLITCSAFELAFGAYQYDAASCSSNYAQAAIQPQLDCALQIAHNVQGVLGLPGQIATDIDRILALLLGAQPYTGYAPTATWTGRDFVSMMFNGVFPNGWNHPFTWPGVTAIGAPGDGPTQGPLGADDVKIYCNEDRYTWDPDVQVDANDATGDWYDPATRQYMEIYSQSKSPKICGLTTFAYVVTPEDNTQPSVMTVCPTFISYMSTHIFPRCDNFLDNVKGVILAGGLNTLKTILRLKNLIYTEIDVAALPAKVMLHELFHTRAGGTLNDCAYEPGPDGLQANGIGASAYGWKKCLKLATIRGATGSPMQSATKNADTFALIGTALSLLNAGAVVQDDGSLKGLPANWWQPQGGKSRRDLEMLMARNFTS